MFGAESQLTPMLGNQDRARRGERHDLNSRPGVCDPGLQEENCLLTDGGLISVGLHACSGPTSRHMSLFAALSIPGLCFLTMSIKDGNEVMFSIGNNIFPSAVRQRQSNFVEPDSARTQCQTQPP